MQSGLTFKNPIYFMWYSAEEEGLVGSQQVVDAFQKEKTPVAAVLHFDLTGYAYKNDPTLWLMRDNTDSDLNKFLEEIIKTYVKRNFKYTACGYACSDHASWHEAGYKTTFAAEAKMEYSNPYMHSSEDTIDKLTLTHMTDYAKIAASFAIELAEPTSSQKQ
jgi:leucyl aminopeptidase